MEALGIIGFLALIAGIIMLIVNAIRRRTLRVWGIITVVGLVFFIIGMSLSGPTTPTPEPTPTPAPAPTPKPPPAPTPAVYSINQNVEVGSARWVVLAARDRGDVLKASESRYAIFAKDKTTTGRFIEVTLEVENIGKTTESFVSEPTLIDYKEREFKSASDVYEWIPEGKEFLLAELHPGVSKQFILIYEVAKDATGLKLKVRDISFWGTKTALIDLGL